MDVVPPMQGSVLPVAEGREDGARWRRRAAAGSARPAPFQRSPRECPCRKVAAAPVPAAVKLDPAGGVMPLAAQEPMPLVPIPPPSNMGAGDWPAADPMPGQAAVPAGTEPIEDAEPTGLMPLPTELRRTEGDSDGANRRPDIADGSVGRHARAEGGACADGLGLRRAAYRDEDHEKGQGRRVRFHVHLQGAAGNPHAGAAETRELAIRRRREHPPAARRPP